MKKILFVAVSAIIMLCGCINKDYKIQILDKDGKVISEKSFSSYNDTCAYLDGYKNFLIEKEVEAEFVRDGTFSETEKDTFRIFNEKNEDITGISFASKEVAKDSIIKGVKEYSNNFIRESNYTAESETHEIDSAKIKELMPYFKTEVDEFDVNHRKWITPNTAAKYANANSIYFYFSTTGDKVGNLRLKVQYYADDWLFIRKYIFNIDGFPIEFVPGEVKRDNNYGKIWEWSDDKMTPFEANLVDLIRYSKAIKVKFVGDDYEKIRALSNKEVQSMKRTIELYYAMGGSI